MFRRLIITWLVLSILGTGMAVAADFHDDSLPGQAHMLGGYSGTLDHPENNDLAHDHCGHAAFHLLGLSSIPTDIKFRGSHTPEDRYSVVWDSYLSPPPSHPPKA